MELARGSLDRCASINNQSNKGLTTMRAACEPSTGGVRAKATLAITGALVIALGAQAHAAPKCPPDSVRSGTGCMDKYEASAWRIPNPTTSNKSLVSKVQKGKAKLNDLTVGGATQLGVASPNFAPCNDNGSACTDIFAVSLPGVTPSASITWFQAVEACGNSRKRLPSSAEWQKAVTNTPDPGPDNGTTDCNTAGAGTVASTGSRSACVSSVGAFDMVGNLDEWVADWVPASTGCPGWGGFSNDHMCVSGASTTATGPGAIVRGGDSFLGPLAGPLEANSLNSPSTANPIFGFRCVR